MAGSCSKRGLSIPAFRSFLHFPASAPKNQSATRTQILHLRHQRRSYAQIFTVLPVSKATLSRILRRYGLNRLSSLEPPKPPVIRYERDAPGELLHLDIKKLGLLPAPASAALRQAVSLRSVRKPSVRALGDRAHRSPGSGAESLHVAIDDHSRLTFPTLFPDEKTPSVLGALQQTLDFYQAHSIKIKRVLTDRGSTYRSKLFAAACQQLGLRHLFTNPYRL